MKQDTSTVDHTPYKEGDCLDSAGHGNSVEERSEQLLG